MPSYCTYGTVLSSDIELPELIATEAAASVAISIGDIVCPGLDPSRPVDRRFNAADGGIYAWWHNVGSYFIHQGKKMVINPVENCEPEITRIFLLGTSLSILLHQRNNLVFHAGVIEFGDSAIAIAGEKEAGKSTTLSLLLKKGHRLISDDLLCCNWNADEMIVEPGFPQMKLWPETCSLLNLNPEDLPKIHSRIEKRAYRLKDKQFLNSKRPLKCMMILKHVPDLKEIQIGMLPPQMAILSLMPHWYGARFGGHLLDALGRENHLKQCSSMVSKLPIIQVAHGKNIEQVDLLIEKIEEYVAELKYPAKI